MSLKCLIRIKLNIFKYLIKVINLKFIAISYYNINNIYNL